MDVSSSIRDWRERLCDWRRSFERGRESEQDEITRTPGEARLLPSFFASHGQRSGGKGKGDAGGVEAGKARARVMLVVSSRCCRRRGPGKD